MNKRIAQLAISIAAALILHRIDAFDALLAFLLTGAVPGTTLNIPSLPMLLLTTGAIWFLLLKFTVLKTWHRKITDRLMSLDKATSARRTGHNPSV